MSKQEDNAVNTDLHELVCKEVDNKMKPILIMIASEGQQTRSAFKNLEDLVIRKRLFYRKVVLGCLVFIALIFISGCVI